MPMVMITGQKAILTARQARFQIVDVVGSMKPLTKMTRQIVSPQSIPTIVRNAFRVAAEERPGPVHLELPEDVAGAQIPFISSIPVHPLESPIAHPEAINRAAVMILAAKRPLIMIGAAGNRPRLVRSPVRVRSTGPYSFLQYADGQGRRRWRLQSLSRDSGAFGARLCP